MYSNRFKNVHTHDVRNTTFLTRFQELSAGFHGISRFRTKLFPLGYSKKWYWGQSLCEMIFHVLSRNPRIFPRYKNKRVSPTYTFYSWPRSHLYRPIHVGLKQVFTIVVFHDFQKARQNNASSLRKKNTCTYKHYVTIPISSCFKLYISIPGIYEWNAAHKYSNEAHFGKVFAPLQRNAVFVRTLTLAASSN